MGNIPHWYHQMETRLETLCKEYDVVYPPKGVARQVYPQAMDGALDFSAPLVWDDGGMGEGRGEGRGDAVDDVWEWLCGNGSRMRNVWSHAHEYT